MATSANHSKPSKWLSNKAFKLSLHRLRRSKSGPPTPPPSPHVDRPKEFHEAFRRFDCDGDGKISSNELRAFFAWAGEDINLDEAQQVIADFDSDGDGLMDYDDFVRLMERDNNGRDEDLRRAFEMFELEKGSGCITPKGLQRVLSRLGDVRSIEECETMMKAYDLDGDGVLDFHEFRRMMT
ncbi:probable calcium-binding protein CML41 [Elaeis guineensis]|uniref:Probable calcium-binding protein CML41 n=1 Tax=Elaeis guineensis var. tenera TaxID=51953 RepID=A0A6I9RSJ4_ELAGV|nr:probable calcium-binding protein CML41 [Elaeis guineensis]